MNQSVNRVVPFDTVDALLAGVTGTLHITVCMCTADKCYQTVLIC